MENISQSNESSPAHDSLPGSEKKILDIGRRASQALDKVLSQSAIEDKSDLRRWGEIGGFCAMLVGAKPSLDTPENWSFGRPILEKIIEEDPALKFAFDTMPGYKMVNREALLQTFQQNPDYLPKVANYDQAKEFFIKTYHLGLDSENMESQEFTNQVVRTGLFLGYPKEESAKMAHHIQKGFQQMYDLIEFTDPKEVFNKTGISSEELQILRDYQEATIHHGQGLVSQNLRKAEVMKFRVKSILDKATGVDPKVKTLFLARRGFMFNQVGWVGYNDSEASIEAMQQIDSQFQKTGMKDVLIKHDIVLQGHNISSYATTTAA